MNARLLILLSLPACTSDAVTLGEDWNTLHYRHITVDIFSRVPAPLGLVRPLNGVDGAPLARAEGLPDLTHAYWDRPNGSDELDGAHVDIVRVGPERCALALDGLYDPGRAASDPAAFDFTTLDRYVASAAEARGDGVLLALDLARAGLCGPGDAFEDALDAPALWAEVAASATRHLVGDTAWEAQAKHLPVVAVQLFRAGADPERAFALFDAAARRVREVAPSVQIVSPELTLTAGSTTVDDFARRALAAATPLDVIALSVGGEAATVAHLVGDLAARLDALGLPVDLAITTLALPPLELPYPAGSPLGLAHLGASEAAARIRLQDQPVRWLVSGFAPWTQAASGELVPSPYFDEDGTATPAFVLRVPMRQITGEQRVVATTDGGDDLSVLATLDEGHLSILVAHPSTATGVASITYTLAIPGFTLPQYPEVDYRLAELDQSNHGVTSFFFSDLGTLPVDPESGDVRIVRTLPVPGVHFIEVDQPTP